MKLTGLRLLLALLCLAGTFPARGSGFMVDHNAVWAFTNLTSADIARVKKLWVSWAGTSHSGGVRAGCQLLQSNVDARCQVNVLDSANYPGPVPEGATTNYLRLSRATWLWDVPPGWMYAFRGSDYYTTTQAVTSTKMSLAYCATNGPRLDVFAFAWSWDFSWHNDTAAGGTNSTYGCQWAGSSVNGPDGDLRWGLTAADYPLTGNHVCMDTYLSATEQCRSFCRTNGYPTTVLFSTAPVDWSSATAYQAFVKNNYIRSYVSNTVDGICFDFADILCWDDAGRRYTNAWTDLAGKARYYEWLAPDNYLNLDGSNGTGNDYHIGQRGAIRLGKAFWWMLARLTSGDRDGDGMPDNWESANNLDLANPADANQDADGDGMSNLQEYLSGTDPHNANSVLKLKVDGVNGGVVQMEFTASSNIAYTVQVRPSLTTGAWQALANISSQPFERNLMLVDSTTPAASSRFYRVFAQRTVP